MTRRVRVVVRVANAADRSRPALAKHVTRRALTQRGRFGLPDVVLLSEVSTVDVGRITVAGQLFGVVQCGRHGSPQAGVAVVVRRPGGRLVGAARTAVGSPATSAGGGVRMRPLVSRRVTVRGSRARRVWSGHAPPPRAAAARGRFLAAAAALGGVFGGDVNVSVGALRSSWTRRVVGVGVLVLAVPRWIRCGHPVPVDVGSDHAAFDVEVWL